MSTQRWTVRSVNGNGSSESPADCPSVRSEPASHDPGQYGDRQPYRRRQRERERRGSLDQHPNNDCEADESYAAEYRPRRIKRSGLLPPPGPRQACLLFALSRVLFNKCSAGWKDCRKSKKESSDYGPVAT